MGLRAVERVFDQSVVKRAIDQGPCEERAPARSHLYDVPKPGGSGTGLLDLEGVISVKAFRPGEPEANRPAWLIAVHDVAHRSVPPRSTDAQAAVEPHRRPTIVRPQEIALGGQAIEQASDGRRGRRQYTLVYVSDLQLS
jgi:hypothetical protein